MKFTTEQKERILKMLAEWESLQVPEDKTDLKEVAQQVADWYKKTGEEQMKGIFEMENFLRRNPKIHKHTGTGKSNVKYFDT